MAGRARGILGRLERWGTVAENAALVLLLGAMMILAVGQIVMRVFFSSGFVWADELLKLMVLWIALIASVAAARSSRHLRIDVLSHFVPRRLARLPKALADGFAVAICGLLALQSWRYMQLAREFEDTVLVAVPAWLVYSILPLAFALMTYRFALSALGEVWQLLRPAKEEAKG